MRYVGSLFFLLLVWGAKGQTGKNIQEYIEKYKGIAIREMNSYGIPASIKMGQGILESSAGSSELAIKAKNHFGIKCKKDWTGPSYTYDDDEKGECFRKYETAEASFIDHSLFLKNNARYASLFLLDPGDYKSWAIGLRKAGYATNPEYAKLLIKTIEDYGLSMLDVPSADQGNKSPEGSMKNDSREKDTRKKTSAPSSRDDLSDFTLSGSIKHSVKFRNGVKYITARKNDSYERVIAEFSLMPWELYKYNDLSRGAKPKDGEIIYLQPKKRNSPTETHIVLAGETLRDISQNYAVKLKRIRKLNKLETDKLQAGQVLRLR